MVQTRSMVSPVKRARASSVTRPSVATPPRAAYDLRPRTKARVVVTIPQTPYNLRPRIHVA